MSLSFTQQQQLFSDLTNTYNQPEATRIGKSFINILTKQVSRKWKWDYTLKLLQTYTEPNVQFYKLSNDYSKTVAVSVLIGNIKYRPKECPSIGEWERLNSVTTLTSAYPFFYFILNNEIGFYPKPSSVNQINVDYRTSSIDLSFSDYTTGTVTTCPLIGALTVAPAKGDLLATLSSNWNYTTGTYGIKFSSGEFRIVTLTNGSAAVSWTGALTLAATTAITFKTDDTGDLVIGSGTSWTSNFIGKRLKFNAVSGGDEQDYLIQRFYSAILLGLSTDYQGPAISSGSATYAIGEYSNIPDGYQQLPVFRAAELWSIKKDPDSVVYFKTLADDLEKQLKRDRGSGTDTVVVEETDNDNFNPNLTIQAS